MVRIRPQAPWDVSREPPDYRTDNDDQLYGPSRKKVRDYGPSTPATQAAASREMARQVARRRRNYQPSATGSGYWFEGNQLIGTGSEEGGITRRVKPRSLRGPGAV